MLVDSTADLLLYGNAERAIVEVAHELAKGKPVEAIQHLRGTTFLRSEVPAGWTELDSTRIDWPSQVDALPNPYEYESATGSCASSATNTKINSGTNKPATTIAATGREAVTEPVQAEPVKIIPMP